MKKDLNKLYMKQDILSQLESLNAPKDSIVLMHSSFRLIGNVDGGAKALLDTLIEYFTSDGGLFCIPTHTWHNIDKEITLDMNDPSTCLGILSDLAAADPRGIRSHNPTHSIVVFGNRSRAIELIKDEGSICTGTAPESAYGKLCREGGYVLLVGVAHDKNTYLHCVEEMLGIPERLTEKPYTLTVKLESGELLKQNIHLCHSSFTNDISQRFRKYETAFRYRGAIRDGFIGNAPTQLCDARIMKETVGLIVERSNGADPLKDEFSIAPKLYR